MSKFIPNSFQVPNALVDNVLADLSGAEIKCYLVVVRKTRGWQKDMDAISVTQFVAATGLSNRAVIDACKSLIEKGLLKQEESGVRGVNVYSIDQCENFTSEKSSLVKKVHSTGEKSSLVTSEESSHTKDTIKYTPKKTVEQPAQAEPQQQPKPTKKTSRATTLPTDFAISEQVREWATKQGFAPWLDLHLEHFRDYALSKGKTYADWDAAFRNAIRDDWGDVRKRTPSPAPVPVAAHKPRTDVVSPERRSERVAMLRAAMLKGVH